MGWLRWCDPFDLDRATDRNGTSPTTAHAHTAPGKAPPFAGIGATGFPWCPPFRAGVSCAATAPPRQPPAPPGEAPGRPCDQLRQRRGAVATPAAGAVATPAGNMTATAPGTSHTTRKSCAAALPEHASTSHAKRWPAPGPACTTPTALHTRPPCAPAGPTGCLKRSERLPRVPTPTRPGRELRSHCTTSTATGPTW
jgi:hypothetical protein